MKYLLLLPLITLIGCGDGGGSTPAAGSAEPVAYNLDTSHDDSKATCMELAKRYSDAQKPRCLEVFSESKCQTDYDFNMQKAALDFETSFEVAKAYLVACNDYNLGFFKADCLANFQSDMAVNISDCANVHT